MSSAVRMTDDERRRRLVRRHHLGRTAADVMDLARSLVAVHSTDPSTPYLSMRARLAGFETSDLDRALCEDRTLWRLHAMRGTLFLVPREDAEIFEAGATRQIAGQERRRVEKWLEAEVSREEFARLVSDLESQVLEVLGEPVELRTQELTEKIPGLGTQVTLGSGTWSTRTKLSSRFLFLMAMDGSIVRTRSAGSWRSSQYHWASTTRWFGQAFDRREPGEGQVEIARRYLSAYGPVSLTDLRWWTGWTAREAKAALAKLETVPVRFDGGDEGMILADDVDPVVPEAAGVALLPALDSTPMGWKSRDWYLGPHSEALFDTNGNIGPSVWFDGRIIGGWAQRPDGEVVVRLLEDVGAEVRSLAAEEANELTRWMAGATVIPRFRTPLEKALSSGSRP
ncbi:MAG: winged helix DNA-binding domain-containing protein [Gemmatimonas sp.]|nr:winged helix DNA-binding domain-containing protein [Gemmatimonas sp.]